MITPPLHLAQMLDLRMHHGAGAPSGLGQTNLAPAMGEGAVQ